MRGKQYLKDIDDISGSYDNEGSLGELAPILSSSKGITCRDHNDCQRSDVIIVNFIGAKEISIGTVMEIAWSYAYSIPLILISDENDIHKHPMINECVHYRVSSVEQAAIVASSLLLPVPHR